MRVATIAILKGATMPGRPGGAGQVLESEAEVAFVPCCRQRIPVQLHRDDLRVFGNLALAL